jgi:hypothetical protein
MIFIIAPATNAIGNEKYNLNLSPLTLIKCHLNTVKKTN